MKILMLGWEYPPHIAGGLGTACQGLTWALAEQGVSIHFVVPQLFGGEQAGHMLLTDQLRRAAAPSADDGGWSRRHASFETTRIPALLQPYWSPSQYNSAAQASRAARVKPKSAVPRDDKVAKALIDGEVYGVDLISALYREDFYPEVSGPYGEDIFREVERFTGNVITRIASEEFDVIHAHDWMTFPAAVALSQLTGKPLVVHVHSLERDRSGLYVNQQIEQIERFGLEAADRVIVVSHYTKRMLEQHHGVPAEKVTVIHNGIYPRQAVQDYKIKKTWPRHVVLFLGRITFQKGPGYFVDIASRVIPHIPDVLFVMAGSGDMLAGIVERVEELHLQNHFLFPGFIQGEELEEMFSIADLYVMPSVSEPFGIAALEAISFETPAIISKQSGVAEVLDHALKADFWDVDRMADMIINALLHEELRHELMCQAREEVKRLHWDAAAQKTIAVYQDVAL
jgi:glycogen(starch) synthase